MRGAHVNLERDCVGSKTEPVMVRVVAAVGLGVAVRSVEKTPWHASPDFSALCSSCFFIQGGFLPMAFPTGHH